MTQLFEDVAEQPESRAMTRGLWARRAVMTLLLAVVVAALAGAAGQRPTTSTASGPAAEVKLEAPDTVRGGLFFQARIDIAARRAVQHPRLVLGRGWIEGLQVNSIEPNPMQESSRDGRVVLSYDQLAAGDRLTVWAQFQVNPTQPGRRSFSVELDDAETPAAHIDRTLTVLP